MTKSLFRVTGLALLLTAGAGGAGAQAQAPSSGLILGRVVDAASKTPVPGALVQLGPAPGAAPGGGGPAPRGLRVVADDRGRFVFTNLPAGSYSIAVTTGGTGFEVTGFLTSGLGHLIAPYLNGGYGQRRPGGPLSTITLTEGASLADVEISLWKPGGIDGTVVDESGEPQVGLIVAAVRRTSDEQISNGPTTRTDDRGHYHFGTLTPGDYVVVVPQLAVSLPGEVLEAGAAASAATDPLPTRALVAAGAPIPGQVTSGVQVTNSIAPTVVGEQRHVYRSTFHPSSPSLREARAVTVKTGEIVPGIDITLAPVPAGRVSGVVADEAGPVAGFGVRLMPADTRDGAEVLEVAWTATDPRGRFEFATVASGAYRIVAQRSAAVPVAVNPQGAVVTGEARSTSERPGAWASATVTVDERPTPDVALTVQAPLRVLGRVVFNGATAAPAAERLRTFRLTAAPAREPRRQAPAAPSGTIAADGLFAVQGLAPGSYVFGVPEGPPGWSVQSVTLGGRDIMETAFDVANEDVSDVVVTFTDAAAEVEGTVTGAFDDSAVFLFPADRARWALASRATRTARTVRPDAQGRFSIPRVPPGDYLIVALPEAAAAAWPDTRWLAAVSASASAVRVTAGQKQTLSLSPKELR